MIQELLSGVVEAERKISSISPLQSAASSPTSSSEPQQSLRCPRCDSLNTKFCYYNNYNLTQPRHFCKTCRRYWTKGGALRNIPIGGGCRKARPVAPSIATGVSGGKSGGGAKARPMPSLTSISDVMGRTAAGGLDHGPDLLPPCSPILWARMPHGSHLLALLRAGQMQNPNPNPNPNASLLNSIRIKEAQMLAEGNCTVNGAHNSSLEHLGPFYNHHQQMQQTQQNLLLNDMPTSSGIQELYQRLRSSSAGGSFCSSSENLQVIASNVGSGNNGTSSVSNNTMATMASSSTFEPIPLSAGDIGYWSPAMTWPDLSATANGDTFP